MNDKKIKVSGLSFIEFTGSKPSLLRDLFASMHLSMKHHKTDEEITLHQSEQINFISNPSAKGNVANFREVHGRGASAMGFKVEDSTAALELALQLGAEQVKDTNYDIPAIKGIGESLIYLVDENHEKVLFNLFESQNRISSIKHNKLIEIDHLTHNLYPNGIEKYKGFYEKLFGFKSVRSFNIDGKKTGLYSEVISSECGKIVIPLNETKDDKSQIAEYLREYNGEGIQHIALRSSDLVESIQLLEDSGVEFQDTPDTYYELLEKRLPGHGESIELMQKHKILIDGGEAQGGGYLLQIFTKNSIGPIFFEYIQRKGNDGFGEGNFQALFESIELDQERRGLL